MSDTPSLKGWNHTPNVPLQASPLFTRPFNLANFLAWVWNSWFLISERLIIVGIAFVSFFWLQPPLEQTKTLAFDWIAIMYIRNLILFTAVAGGLHWYFYIWKKQGSHLKYDPRELMKNGRQFTWNGQVRDNIFWSLGSGVFFWTGYEVLMFWSLANGYVPMLTWTANPVWFVAFFLLIPAWESFYFYWIHRFLHIPWLYKKVHSLHHRNINVGPWSGLSMHPVEQFIYLGTVFIHFIIGAHPVHILFHLQYYTLTAATTHTGFEAMVVKDKNRLKLGTFHHQMHHRYFECNYGGLEIPWDKFFGSFHDGTPEANEVMKDRRKRMMG
jgi:sterol desaturase/sphingolipid hydroxylase (fatty acid hydroxylase superfamily)